MKFYPAMCPICGDLAKGTLETLTGVALLIIDADTGEAEYAGETEIWWDDQKSIQDAQGRYTLMCGNGHEWPAEVKESSCDQVPSEYVVVPAQHKP